MVFWVVIRSPVACVKHAAEETLTSRRAQAADAHTDDTRALVLNTPTCTPLTHLRSDLQHLSCLGASPLRRALCPAAAVIGWLRVWVQRGMPHSTSEQSDRLVPAHAAVCEHLGTMTLLT